MTRRIGFLDLWRSAAVWAMVVYHFLFTMRNFGYLSDAVLFSTPLNIFQKLICTSFIFISGVSCGLSRSNVRRGLRVLLAAAVVTAGSLLVQDPIKFGILHFLGIAMLIWAYLGKYLLKIPRFLAPVLWLSLYALTYIWISRTPVSAGWLFPLGFIRSDFYSADYFPIFPWIFLFFLGAWASGELKHLSSWKFLSREYHPALVWTGRNSLLIYLIHQPIFYGIFYLIGILSTN